MNLSRRKNCWGVEEGMEEGGGNYLHLLLLVYEVPHLSGTWKMSLIEIRIF